MHGKKLLFESLLLFALLGASVFFMSSCGGVTAPSDATITINPSSLSITGLAGSTNYNFTVIVKDKQGNPLGDVEVLISGPFAEPRTPARYQFYRKPDGVEQVNSSFTAKTDEYGVYDFSIKIYAAVDGEPNAFEDEIDVRSGSAFGSASLTVSGGAVVDFTLPEVISTVPTNGASGVALNSTVTINWNENIDCDTVNTTNITISPVPTIWTRTFCSGSQAVFTPSGQAKNTSYTVTVTKNVRDVVGNKMFSDYAFSYTTVP